MCLQPIAIASYVSSTEAVTQKQMGKSKQNIPPLPGFEPQATCSLVKCHTQLPPKMDRYFSLPLSSYIAI